MWRLLRKSTKRSFAVTTPGEFRKMLMNCREHGITLNPEKFKLAQDEVKFAGFIIGSKGVKADPEKIKAIAKFPTPTNITDLRSFIGLTEQLAGFSKEVSQALLPLRPLLKSKSHWIWNNDHAQAFESTKAALCSPPILTTFDPAKPTMLQTEASRLKGLGYVLLQKD